MYTLKSESSEGVFYLYKGWGTQKWYGIMWSKEKPYNARFLFKSPASAWASFTKLCKIMPEYRTDKVTIEEV